MFHIVYDKEYGWMWWYGENGSFGPEFVNMGWYRTKDECITDIKRIQRLIPLATIEDPATPKPPPFSMPRLR